MTLHTEIVAQTHIPGIFMEVEKYRLTTGTGDSGCTDDHVLHMMQTDSGSVRTLTRWGSGRAHFPMRVGELCFAPAQVPWSTHSYGDASGRTFVCRFEPTAFAQRVGLRRDWECSELRPFHPVNNSLIKGLVLRLIQELISPGFASDILIDSMGGMLTVELARHFQVFSLKTKPQHGQLTQWQLNRVRDYVESTSERPIAVRELADICGIGERHLQRTFKNTTGETLGAYVEQVKISKAQTLLSKGEPTLKQISHHLGFASADGFSRAFRRATGETPRTYRRRTQR